MHRTGQTVVMPRREPGVGEQPYLDFAAGYVLRGVDAFPKQGMRHPWRLKMNYLVDRKNLRSSSIADDILEFSTPVERAAS
jgi:monooxygenase